MSGECASPMAAWVPRATSTVRRVTRPCSAPWTAASSSGQRAAAGARRARGRRRYGRRRSTGELLADEGVDLRRLK